MRRRRPKQPHPGPRGARKCQMPFAMPGGGGLSEFPPSSPPRPCGPKGSASARQRPRGRGLSSSAALNTRKLRLGEHHDAETQTCLHASERRLCFRAGQVAGTQHLGLGHVLTVLPRSEKRPDRRWPGAFLCATVTSAARWRPKPLPQPLEQYRTHRKYPENVSYPKTRI